MLNSFTTRPSSAPKTEPISNKPLIPASRLGVPAGSLHKWSSTPVSRSSSSSLPKPGLFENRRAMYEGVSTKKVIQELKKGLTIPGTGGKMYGKEEFKKILKDRFSYGKFNTQVKPLEAKNFLSKLRHEADINPSKSRELNRQGRTFEEKFEKMGLKFKQKYFKGRY